MFEDKKNLLNRINNIKNKTHLSQIKNIIFEFNKDLNYTKTSSGICLFFHNLHNDTYIKIDKFINSIEPVKVEITKNVTKSNITTNTNTESRFKLSNAEINILKKKEYMDEINQNVLSEEMYLSEEIYKSEDNKNNESDENIKNTSKQTIKQTNKQPNKQQVKQPIKKK